MSPLSMISRSTSLTHLSIRNTDAHVSVCTIQLLNFLNGYITNISWLYIQPFSNFRKTARLHLVAKIDYF